MNKHDF